MTTIVDIRKALASPEVLSFSETVESAFIASAKNAEFDKDTQCSYLTIEGCFDCAEISKKFPSVDNAGELFKKTIIDQESDPDPFERNLIFDTFSENEDLLFVDGRVNMTKIINAFDGSKTNR